MYTIKEAARRSGLTVPLLHAWERRYGIVHPPRTASGYRVYDEDAVARLTAMRSLVASGWSPNNAARAILDGTAPPEATTPPPVLGALDTNGTGAAAAAPPRAEDELVERFVAAATHLDAPAIELVLDETFALQGFERGVERVVLPVLRRLGDAWAAGTADVAAEHLASEAVHARLGAAYAAAARPGARVEVLVGLPPGSRHEFGGLAFAAAARRAGLSTLYLGADVPAESWLRAVEDTAARAVVLALTTASDERPAREVIDALAKLERPPVVAVGGPAASALAPGALVLDADLAAAAGALAARLRRRS